MRFSTLGKEALYFSIGASLLMVLFFEQVYAGPREQATRMFDRLASAPLSRTDARRAQMETLITQGNLLGAAQIATADDRFYNLTVRSWATPMSNREEDPLIAQENDGGTRLTDFIAMVIGTVRDNRNAQELLNGDFTYYVTQTIANVTPYTPITWRDGTHYDSLDKARVNLRQTLVRVTPQHLDFPDSAGLLTSQAWGHAHARGGTNRRMVHYSIRQFLCTDIEQLRDTVFPTTRIRRDVDRAPGGDPAVFETKCKTCHGGQDGLAGAFAYYDFVNVGAPDAAAGDPPLPAGYFPGDQLMRYPNAITATAPSGGGPLRTVVRKMNQNGGVYPTGYVTVDDSWVNNFRLSTSPANLAIGWPATMTSGNGIRSYGTMLANTRGFSTCMAKRVFRKVCGRQPATADDASISTLADQFSTGGYNLKNLFERAAILPQCLGN